MIYVIQPWPFSSYKLKHTINATEYGRPVFANFLETNNS
jgi:hypothetical protein